MHLRPLRPLKPLRWMPLPVAILCALALGVPAFAGEEEAPGKKAPPKKAEAKAPAQPAPTPPPGLTRQDIEELVKRGGRLPEGFVPHGMRPGTRGPGAGPAGPRPGQPPFLRGPGAFGLASGAEGALTKAMGQLVLKYLDEKDDPVRAEVYEDLLREIATVMARGESGSVAALMPMLMGRLIAGLGDPKKAPVYREIMTIFGQALVTVDPKPPAFVPGTAGPVTPPADRPPAAPQDPGGTQPLAPTQGQWPTSFAGAEVIYVGTGDPAAVMQVHLRRIPESSLAWQAGLRPGHRILAIDGKPATPARLREAEKAFTPGGKLLLRLRRMNGTIDVLNLEFEADDEPDAGGQAGPGK